MNATQNGLGLAASLIHAQSQLSSVSVSGLMKLQKLECLLNTARGKLLGGEALSSADIRCLNSALDDLEPM